MNTKQYLELLDSRKRDTNYPAHILLTVITLGAWLPVWFYCDMHNYHANLRIDSLMGLVLEHFNLAREAGVMELLWEETSEGKILADGIPLYSADEIQPKSLRSKVHDFRKAQRIRLLHSRLGQIAEMREEWDETEQAIYEELRAL